MFWLGYWRVLTGRLYGFSIIIETIIVVAGVLVYGIGNIIGFYLVYGICLEIYETLK